MPLEVLVLYDTDATVEMLLSVISVTRKFELQSVGVGISRRVAGSWRVRVQQHCWGQVACYLLPVPVTRRELL